ncbi:MAG: hypothetical protein H6R10_1144 [Rhodocyclaceae bacterium]|nr:hypothetical protein [Rhodocyclaceae bacterium]
MTHTLIRNGNLVADDWTILQLAEGDSPAAVALPAGKTFFPLAVWQARRADILARGEPVGLLLQPDDRVEDIVPDLPRFAAIAVHFPKFADGRGFSTASLLRQRHGYRGELRAVGDVVHDTLFYLKRVGFDAFALRSGKDAEYAAEEGFDAFSERYQAAADQPLPYFRRRSA